jgi:hypothetical protein
MKSQIQTETNFRKMVRNMERSQRQNSKKEYLPTGVILLVVNFFEKWAVDWFSYVFKYVGGSNWNTLTNNKWITCMNIYMIISYPLVCPMSDVVPGLAECEKQVHLWGGLRLLQRPGANPISWRWVHAIAIVSSSSSKLDAVVAI